MWRRIALLCLVYFWIGGSVWAQQSEEELKFIIAPKDAYLLTIASQPDCPIQIENAKLLLAIGVGNWGASYRLRNAGTKPLRVHSVTLSMWTAQGIGSTWQVVTQDADKAVLPGELITIKEDDPKIEIVPLTDEVRDKMKLRGPLHAVVVLMVEQVKFSDGSVYRDERTSKALQSYFQNIDFVEYKAK
jgi:hypothetical protein